MKSRLLLRDSRVVLRYNGREYVLPSVSSIDAEMSYNEYSGSRKTLFNKAGHSRYSLVSEVRATSVSMSMYLNNPAVDGVFFELLGLTRKGNSYSVPYALPVSPEYFELLVINGSSTTVLSPCFIETADITMARGDPLLLNVSISSGNFEQTSAIRYTGPPLVSNPLAPTPVYVDIGTQTIGSITSVALSIQQTCEWREDRSLFATGSLHSKSRAVLTDLLVSMVISNNLDTSKQFIDPVIADVSVSQSGFGVQMSSARVFPRTSLSTIYKNNLDVSTSQDTDSVIITYGE